MENDDSTSAPLFPLRASEDPIHIGYVRGAYHEVHGKD
jgi:hypothetical protein